MLVLALGTLDCAVPPEEDCSAKATCAALSPGDAAARDATLPTDSATDSPADHAADAAVEETTAVPCDNDNQYVCIPPVPDGWLGPVAEWQGSTGSVPPDCPPGYNGGSHTDNYGALTAPAATCVCSCTATGQACAASVTIYNDLTCTSPCASSVTAGTCSPVTGCLGNQGTLQADMPVPKGGSCVPSVVASVVPAAWTNPSRICPTAQVGDAEYACPAPGDLCVRIPDLPFGTRPCVAEVVPDGQTPPVTCPVDYPHGPYLSYSYMSDDRKCGPCTCGKDPDGGSCAGTIALAGAGDQDCSMDAAVTYTIGSGCSDKFALSNPVATISGKYTVVGAQCAITINTHAVGSAAPTNPVQVVCCL
jgi:hypothetical protein